MLIGRKVSILELFYSKILSPSVKWQKDHNHICFRCFPLDDPSPSLSNGNGRKNTFEWPKRKNENTLQYKVPPKTWENSPQKPLLATRKWFFGHCYVQNVRFLKILQCPDFEFFFGDTWHLSHTKKLDRSDGGFFFAKNTLSSHVLANATFRKYETHALV